MFGIPICYYGKENSNSIGNILFTLWDYRALERKEDTCILEVNMEYPEICVKPYVWFIERPFIKKESFF